MEENQDKEISELPKILQNSNKQEMNQNSNNVNEIEINDKSNQNTKDNNKFSSLNNKQDSIKQDKKFIKIYIIYIVLLLLITGIAIFLTVKHINNSTNKEVKEEKVESTTTEETKEIAKKRAEDEKFALTKYSETYNENDLIFSELKDGNISYIQIDGLKDKKIQNKVNNRIYELAHSYSTDKEVYSDVTASFSNVLAITISYYNEKREIDKIECLNFDLSTGNEIPFEEVFVSSAPINAILSEGMYKRLAWEIKDKNTNEDNWEDYFNMDKVDASDFEDKSIILAKNYKKNKEKIKYELHFDKVYVYGLLDDIIEEKYNRVIRIDFKNHLENIAIYKRFLTSTSLYENSNIGLKNIIVCQYPFGYSINSYLDYKELNMGFLSDNVYMEDYFSYNSKDIDDNAIKKISKYVQDISNDEKANLTKDTTSGVIYQRIIYPHKERNNLFYYIDLNEAKTTCTIEYFKNEAFKDYIDMKTQARADGSLLLFSGDEYEQKEYPNLKTTTSMYEEKFYFNLDGEFIGKSEEEANNKLNLNNDNNSNIQENNSIPNTTNTTTNNTTVNTNSINNANNSITNTNTNNNFSINTNVSVNEITNTNVNIYNNSYNNTNVTSNNTNATSNVTNSTKNSNTSNNH